MPKKQSTSLSLPARGQIIGADRWPRGVRERVFGRIGGCRLLACVHPKAANLVRAATNVIHSYRVRAAGNYSTSVINTS